VHTAAQHVAVLPKSGVGLPSRPTVWKLALAPKTPTVCGWPEALSRCDEAVRFCFMLVLLKGVLVSYIHNHPNEYTRENADSPEACGATYRHHWRSRRAPAPWGAQSPWVAQSVRKPVTHLREQARRHSATTSMRLRAKLARHCWKTGTEAAQRVRNNSCGHCGQYGSAAGRVR